MPGVYLLIWRHPSLAPFSSSFGGDDPHVFIEPSCQPSFDFTFAKKKAGPLSALPAQPFGPQLLPVFISLLSFFFAAPCHAPRSSTTALDD